MEGHQPTTIPVGPDKTGKSSVAQAQLIYFLPRIQISDSWLANPHDHYLSILSSESTFYHLEEPCPNADNTKYQRTGK